MTMKFMPQIFVTAAMALVFSGAVAQKGSATSSDLTKIPQKKSPLTEKELIRWSHLDLQTDTIPGMSVDKAYREFLNEKKGTTVIVGVIDSGFDIAHEDLKQVIWTNTDEIAANGIDDDKNGYIDDIHGWNFLGDVRNETLEVTRIVKKGDDGSITYQAAKAEYDAKYAEEFQNWQQAEMIMNAHNAVSGYLKKPTYTLEELREIVPNEAISSKSIKIMVSILRQNGPDFYKSFKEYYDQTSETINYRLNLDFDGRKVLGDNPYDFSVRNYGNNNVSGPDITEAVHGTHVAGIIAQGRNNNIGGDGVADNVSIMTIRAVPNGDEYDKDIALAIRYAVDNGAKVINASFGKSYSPQKEWVFEAIKYAASKDVLIVHAAGNDGHNIDLEKYRNYPNDSEDGVIEFSDNVLTIGALDSYSDSRLVADFSNYGTSNVDIFAPGVKIYATVPNNKYDSLQGTSMASPNAAGVAALIRSRFPDLSAKQVKKIIMDSGTPITLDVSLGETKETKSFTAASKSGKLVNAYNALMLAKKQSKTPSKS